MLLFSLPIKTQVGDVDLTKPCSFGFRRKDVSYLPNGSIKIKKAIVWNTPTITEETYIPGRVVGDMPPTPKGLPTADLSKPVRATMNPLNCKPMRDGRAECKDVVFNPEAIKPGEWRRK